MDSADVQSVVVAAESWQKALHAARVSRGDAGPISGFSIELLDEGYRAVDPLARRRYDVKRAADDAAHRRDAAHTTSGTASRTAAARAARSRRASDDDREAPPPAAPPRPGPAAPAPASASPQTAPARKAPPAAPATKAPSVPPPRPAPPVAAAPEPTPAPAPAIVPTAIMSVGVMNGGGADATTRHEPSNMTSHDPHRAGSCSCLRPLRRGPRAGPGPADAGHLQAGARSERAPPAHLPGVRLHRRPRRERGVGRAPPSHAAGPGARVDRERPPGEIREPRRVRRRLPGQAAGAAAGDARVEGLDGRGGRRLPAPRRRQQPSGRPCMRPPPSGRRRRAPSPSPCARAPAPAPPIPPVAPRP